MFITDEVIRAMDYADAYMASLLPKHMSRQEWQERYDRAMRHYMTPEVTLELKELDAYLAAYEEVGE